MNRVIGRSGDRVNNSPDGLVIGPSDNEPATVFCFRSIVQSDLSSTVLPITQSPDHPIKEERWLQV